jgi:hypothetical protein
MNVILSEAKDLTPGVNAYRKHLRINEANQGSWKILFALRGRSLRSGRQRRESNNLTNQ